MHPAICVETNVGVLNSMWVCGIQWGLGSLLRFNVGVGLQCGCVEITLHTALLVRKVIAVSRN